MPLISITRLRIRSVRHLPPFVVHTLRSLRQLRTAPGFQGGSLWLDRHLTFWTVTAWDSQPAMRAFMTVGFHKAAMPHLLDWCDEASVVHWEQASDNLPPLAEADQRMRNDGRPSKVRNPTPRHATLTYAPPRILTAGPVRPAQRRAIRSN